jgi:hypothetical protein
MRGAANVVLLAAVAATVLGTAMGVGAGLATGGDDDAPNATALATVGYVACPGEQTVGVLATNDRVFIVARDESDAWLEIRDPRDLTRRVWVSADSVRADYDVSALNAHGCTTPETLPSTTTTSTTVPPSTTSSSSTSSTSSPASTTTTTLSPPTSAAPTTPPPTEAPPTTPVPTTAAPDTSTPAT